MRRSLVLLMPSSLLLIIQGFGIGATDNELRPIFNLPPGFYWPLVTAGIVLSVVSPITSAAALRVALKQRASWQRMVFILAISVLVATSWVGCLWTFSGHPTWTQGYSGGYSR